MYDFGWRKNVCTLKLYLHRSCSCHFTVQLLIKSMDTKKLKRLHREKERERYSILSDAFEKLSEMAPGSSRYEKKLDKLRRIILFCRSLEWFVRKSTGRKLSKFSDHEKQIFEDLVGIIKKPDNKMKMFAKRKKSAIIVFLKKSTEDQKNSSFHNLPTAKPTCDQSDLPHDYNGEKDFFVDQPSAYPDCLDYFVDNNFPPAYAEAWNEQQGFYMPFEGYVGASFSGEPNSLPNNSGSSLLQSFESSSFSSGYGETQPPCDNTYLNNSHLEAFPYYIGTRNPNTCSSADNMEEKCFLLKSEWQYPQTNEMFFDSSVSSPIKLGRDMKELVLRCLHEE